MRHPSTFLKSFVTLLFSFTILNINAQWKVEVNTTEPGNPLCESSTNPADFVTASGTARYIPQSGNCNSYYFTTFRTTQPICLFTQNFSVKARIRNSSANGNPGFSGDFATYLLILDDTYTLSQMLADGLQSGGATSSIARVSVNNYTNNIPSNGQLNSLCFNNLNDYKIFEIKVSNGNQVTYFVDGIQLRDNNNALITQTINRTFCSINLYSAFRGWGEMDWITVTDNNSGNTFYEEQFNSTQLTPVTSCNSSNNVTASYLAPTCADNNLTLNATPSAVGSYNYNWTGPNGFVSSLQNPIINSPQLNNLGTYYLKATSTSLCQLEFYDTLEVQFSVPNCNTCPDTSCYWTLNGNNVINDNFIGSKNNSDLKMRTNNIERLRISANGNIGINNDQPYFNLELGKGSGSAIQRINGGAQNSEGAATIYARGANHIMWIGTESNALGNNSEDGISYLYGDRNYHIMTGAQKRLTVLSNGNIGLGNDQPYFNLELGKGSGNAIQRINGGAQNSEGAATIYARGANHIMWIGTESNALGNNSEDGISYLYGDRNYHIMTGGQKRLTVLANGNLGIGSTSPTKKLDVNGEARVAELPTSLTTDRIVSANSNGDLKSIMLSGDTTTYLSGNGTWKALPQCCNSTTQGMQAIFDRLERLENEIILLKEKQTQADVLLQEHNIIVLEQNIPNPFKEKTSVNYFIPNNFFKAQILVHNINGELIKSIPITMKGKGTITFYAHNISAGLYTYTLQIDGKNIETKKMIKQ